MTNCISIALAGSISVLALISTAAAQDGSPKLALNKEEVSALLKGTLIMIDRGTGRGAGNQVRMEFREDGKVWANSTSGMSNSGSFLVNDDGSMCQKWNDERWRKEWCYRLYQDGDSVQFQAIFADPPFTGLKWEMKK